MPRFPHVKAIVAVGNFGQIGNKGVLPWHDKRDLAHFKLLTMGGLCVVGSKTAHTLPRLEGRDVYIWRREDDPIAFANINNGRDIWIIGGAAIYKRWLPFVGMTILTHIDFDTQCDTYMPWLWRMPTPNRERTRND